MLFIHSKPIGLQQILYPFGLFYPCDGVRTGMVLVPANVAAELDPEPEPDAPAIRVVCANARSRRGVLHRESFATGGTLDVSESMSNMLRRARYDAVVVGGGVVGLAVARALQLGGLECCLLEAQEHLAASGASAGNTGIACTSPDAARGSLERTLLERAEALNLRAYEAHGLLPVRRPRRRPCSASLGGYLDGFCSTIALTSDPSSKTKR